MILADKIVQLRKQNNWSQEELAEKLDVSRQSVSKWEGALSVPDLDKIIKLSEIFQVSTDYLLKDDVTDNSATYSDSFSGESIRNITLEEANAYISDKKKANLSIAIGVMCCILSPIVLIFLAGMAESDRFNISEGLACVIGVTTLLVLVVCAVSDFILTGLKLSKYEYISKEPFKLCYGVAQVVKDKKDHQAGKLAAGIIIGVALCILCPVPIIISAVLEAPDLVIIGCVCILLFIVSIAVFLFIVTGAESECYKQLLQLDEYSAEYKTNNQLEEKIGGVYWPIITVAYLLSSFLSGEWGMTWLIWPCAGIIFGAICTIVKTSRH